MENRNRMVGLFYFGLTVVGILVFSNTVELLLSLFNVTDLQIVNRLLSVSDIFGVALALGLTLYLSRHPEFGPMVHQVNEETSKVTWPTWDETASNTVTTVVVTVIIAAILWGFDQVFGNVTNQLLGGA